MNIVHRLQAALYALTMPNRHPRIGSHTKDGWRVAGGAALAYMVFFDSLGRDGDADLMVAAFKERVGSSPRLVILSVDGGRAMGPVGKEHADVLLVLTCDSSHRPFWILTPVKSE